MSAKKAISDRLKEFAAIIDKDEPGSPWAYAQMEDLVAFLNEMKDIARVDAVREGLLKSVVPILGTPEPEPEVNEDQWVFPVEATTEVVEEKSEEPAPTPAPVAAKKAAKTKAAENNKE